LSCHTKATQFQLSPCTGSSKVCHRKCNVVHVTMIAYCGHGRVRSEVRGQGSLNNNFIDKHRMASASCIVNRKQVVSTNQDTGQTFQLGEEGYGKGNEIMPACSMGPGSTPSRSHRPQTTASTGHRDAISPINPAS